MQLSEEELILLGESIQKSIQYEHKIAQGALVLKETSNDPAELRMAEMLGAMTSDKILDLEEMAERIKEEWTDESIRERFLERAKALI